jgi:hypothetical protein
MDFPVYRKRAGHIYKVLSAESVISLWDDVNITGYGISNNPSVVGEILDNYLESDEGEFKAALKEIKAQLAPVVGK